MIVNGTAFDDRLTGSDSDDVIDGYAGDDIIEGASGNDVLYGGDGADYISGGRGDDVLEGGAGDDNLVDWNGGSDTLRGGSGDDRIFVLRQDASDAMRSVVIDGGTGDDKVTFRGFVATTINVSLGEGDDLFSLGYAVDGGELSVTTGTGRDVITLEVFAPVGSDLVVTDFQSGDAGDIFDIADFTGLNSVDWDGSNPFGAGGYLRLRQSGDAALIEMDRDGTAGSRFDFVTLARLADTAIETLTAANFAGYAPLGTVVGGTILTGTVSPDTLKGSIGSDIIFGDAGNDRIDGGNGSDRIDGGAGADIITSGYGNDIVDGGDGDDIIEDVGGSDTLRGGAGNDTISVTRFSGLGTEAIQIDAGIGDDTVSFSSGKAGTAVIDLGGGDDQMTIDLMGANVRLTLGAGQDKVELAYFAPDNGALTITDFNTGAAGDMIIFSSAFLDGFSNRKSGNPFSQGYLRLLQSGNDTVLQADADGVGGDVDFATIAVFEGVNASSLTKSNFNGLTPKVVKVAQPDPNATVGTNIGDNLYGTAGNDVLRGLAGNDYLDGGVGRDILDGGTGNDILRGGHDSDIFLFAGKSAGSDEIVDFGVDDLLVTTRKLVDGNRDGKIDFGRDRDLDFTGGGHTVIFDETDSKLTSLEYDGSFTAGQVTYYVYSRIGSAVGVGDADALL